MRSVLLAVVMFVSVRPGAADAQAFDAETPRSGALGSGARASAGSTTALAQNTAALTSSRAYHLESTVAHGFGSGQWSFGAAIVDSMTNKLAAGFGARAVLGPDGGYSGWDGRVGLGFPLADALSIGVAGRYLDLSCNQQCGALGDGAEMADGFTLDASVLLAPAPWLRLAALGYNLIDRESALVPTRAGGSASISVGEALVLGADVLADLTTYDRARWIAGGGIEYLAGGQIPIRAGYEYDEGRRQHSLSAGIGYVDQRVGVDVAVRHALRGDDGTSLVAGLRYFVH